MSQDDRVLRFWLLKICIINSHLSMIQYIYFCGGGKRLQHTRRATLESVKIQDNFRKYRVQCKSICPDKYQLSFDCDAPISYFMAESPNPAAASPERSQEAVAVIAESQRHLIMIIWKTAPFLTH